MKLSRLVIVGIYIYLVCLWGLFGIYGSNWLININTIALLTGISIFFMSVLLIFKRVHPVLLLFIVISFMYFNLRILALIIEPERLYDQFSPASASDMNKALLYFFLGNLFAVAGVFVGEKFFSRSHSFIEGTDENWEKINFAKQSTVFFSLILILAELNMIYGYLKVGMSRHGYEALNMSVLMKAFYSFIDIDVFLIILIVIIGEQWKQLDSRVKIMPGIAVLGYVLTRVILTSKAAVYNPLLFFLLYILCKKGDPKVNVKRIALIILPILILALVTFNAAKQLRQDWLNIRDQSITLTYIYDNLSKKPMSHYFNVLPPLHRLQGIDPLINVVNEKGVNVDRYVNLTNEFKSFLNLTLPGRPFRVPLTAQSYAIVYFPVDESLYLDEGQYTTFIWTMWGLFYVLFGQIGGLIVIFFALLILTILYNKSSRMKSKYKIFLQFTCLFAAYWTYISFGLDNMMDMIVKALIQGCLFFSLLYLYHKLMVNNPKASRVLPVLIGNIKKANIPLNRGK